MSGMSPLWSHSSKLYQFQEDYQQVAPLDLPGAQVNTDQQNTYSTVLAQANPYTTPNPYQYIRPQQNYQSATATSTQQGILILRCSSIQQPSSSTCYCCLQSRASLSSYSSILQPSSSTCWCCLQHSTFLKLWQLLAMLSILLQCGILIPEH